MGYNGMITSKNHGKVEEMPIKRLNSKSNNACAAYCEEIFHYD